MVSSTPRPHFTPGKEVVHILQEAGWATGPVWTSGKSPPHRDSIPDRPARSSVAIPTELRGSTLNTVVHKYTARNFYCFTVHFCSLSFSPTYALIYIMKILSQAVTLIAHFTPTCFDPYGSSSGSTAGLC